jgi:hypothetical protein
MYVYLDESGTFVIPQPPASSISAIGALVIPACYKSAIWKRYRRMRAHLPKDNGEVKGRLLGEPHVAGLVEMLGKTPVLFNVVAIDMGMQTIHNIERHRDEQAIKIIYPEGAEYSAEMVASLERLSRRLTSTPPQLYTQSVLIFELVMKALQHAMILYSQILPKDLGSISWIFDAKNKTKLTDWEDWWKTMVAPCLQSMALQTPFIGLKEGNYSYFDRAFQIETAPWYNKISENDAPYCTNIGLVLKDLTFESGVNYGLEMVDILTNAIRRALSGRLGEAGWSSISKLIPKMREPHRVQLFSFAEPKTTDVRYASVINKLDRYGRSLVPRR